VNQSPFLAQLIDTALYESLRVSTVRDYHYITLCTNIKFIYMHTFGWERKGRKREVLMNLMIVKE